MIFPIADHFRAIFGHDPQVLAAAPGRVNLIGEHIDYSEGFVLPFAISQRTFAAVRRREDQKIRVTSLQQDSGTVTVSLDELRAGEGGGWERYPLGVLWALGFGSKIKNGLDLLIDGRVPLGAGLSSSAALECSVAVAVNELFLLGHTLESLAQITQTAENSYVGVPCGIMDQSVSLMAEEGHALLLDCRDLSTKQIPFDLASHNLELLIIDTRAHHALIDGGYAERRADCESVARKLRVRSLRDITIEQLQTSESILTEIEFIRARHAVTEMNRVLDAVEALRRDDFSSLGGLINNSHISLRDDYAVSCPELDLAVETARNCGALGARMTGGGFGGSAIALIDSDKSESTIAAINEAFKRSNFKSPRFFPSLPSQGAQIIQLNQTHY